MTPETKPPPRRSGFFRTLRTVGSAMLGVRGRKTHEEDTPSLSPLQILVVALIFMAIFVATLVTVAINISHH